jgi:signal recognition particle subunit SRP19
MSNPRFEVVDDDDPEEMDLAEFAGSSSAILPAHDLPQPASGGMPTSADAAFKPHMITQQDLEQFKNWSCVYPIYFDASRSYKEGRRVPLKYAIENPMAQQLAVATTSLNIQSIFEVLQGLYQSLIVLSLKKHIQKIGLILDGYGFRYKVKQEGNRLPPSGHYISPCRTICSLILPRLRRH